MSENTGPAKEGPQTGNVRQLSEVLSTKPETPILDPQCARMDLNKRFLP